MQPVLLPPETEGIFLVKLPQIAETKRISYLAAGTKFQDSQPAGQIDVFYRPNVQQKVAKFTI